MANLREKLHSLGYKNENLSQKPEGNIFIDKKDGQREENLIQSSSKVYTFVHSVPLPFLHGDVLIEPSFSFGILSEWVKAPEISTLDLHDVAFVDTETSGLVGGTGTFAFMVGIGVHREGQFQVYQFFLPDPVEEYRLLDEILNFLEPYRVIVTFNGKSFDLPLLQTRVILNRMENRMGEKIHIDLLHLARRFWKARLESCSLSELEKQILHITREQEEIPGYLIPETYFNYLKLRDFSLLDGVFYHNRVDILSLAALLHFMGRVLSQPQESPLHSIDLASIARLYHDLGHWETASELYAQSISEDMPPDFLVKTLLKHAEIHKKQGNTPEAIALWKKAADYGNLEAHLELAKIYEHTLRQLDAALEWANRAFHLCSTLPVPTWKRKEWLHEISHRIERLEEKKRKEIHGSETI